MDSFDIGLSGLNAAQKGFNVLGNNIANAATEGYHRQRIDLTPAYSSQIGSVLLGGGVDVEGVSRLIDNFLEQEILRQQSLLEQASQELTTLQTVENAFGELSETNSLSSAISEFFNALQDLCAHPTEAIWQNQATTTAETMATQFRTLGEFLTTLEEQIILEAQNTIEQINSLISKIAELNYNIKKQEISGGQANNLHDQRDKCISELSELISVETQFLEHGVVNVSVTGIPVVTSTFAFELEVGLNENLELGIAISGESNYKKDVDGGRLGGLLSLKNELISDIHADLDKLASAIVQQINQYHVQGVGSEGSFTELTGWSMASENLADFNPPITSGSVFIRVTDTTVPGTTTITRHEIDIVNDLPADPTLSDLADYITNNITGLTASVFDSKLHIQADTNYKFDFLPCVLPSPTNSDFSGTTSPPTISVSGIYTGTKNQTFTFTVSGDDSVGNGSLQITVTDGDGNTVTTLNVGSGYAAGDKLDAGYGIKIALSTGDLANGNTFEVDAFANTDTSGVLAAAGINTFFSGNNAANIAVCSQIANSPGRVATALGADMMDNTNALRMEDLRNQTVDSLNSMTPGEFYRRLITDVGQQLFVKQMHNDNIQAVVQNLTNQQSKISGVNINDEAAQMLLFEQMFKAMSKYINTVHSALLTIMDML